MATIAPVHDHTRHQEREYTNQMHNSSVLNSKLFSVILSAQLLFSNVSILKCQSVFCFLAKCSNNVALRLNAKFSHDKLKNSQLHKNSDFTDHFLRFRDIRDQVFKKWTLGDLRDQVAALELQARARDRQTDGQDP